MTWKLIAAVTHRFGTKKELIADQIDIDTQKDWTADRHDFLGRFFDVLLISEGLKSLAT